MRYQEMGSLILHTHLPELPTHIGKINCESSRPCLTLHGPSNHTYSPHVRLSPPAGPAASSAEGTESQQALGSKTENQEGCAFPNGAQPEHSNLGRETTYASSAGRSHCGAWSPEARCIGDCDCTCAWERVRTASVRTQVYAHSLRGRIESTLAISCLSWVPATYKVLGITPLFISPVQW